jgi:NAD-dependent SIR2 family protein deacetylase
MKHYRGCQYFKDKDGLWKVVIDAETSFVVAFDDSKLNGKKKVIWKKNTEDVCKKYIDYIVK